MSKVTDNFYIDPKYQLKEIPSEIKDDIPKQEEPEPYDYDPKSGLIKAVNLAIYLRRPLLLEGEAGCGKTRLARAVAHKLRLPYYRWDVRSNSKAQDGLYTYDAILRLHDVQIQKLDRPPEMEPNNPQNSQKNQGEKTNKRDPSKPEDYRKLGALGKAFDFKSCPSVVLIDEIDKAGIDFPNDLLTVLDEPWKFTIPETGETIEATEGNYPIVIITSNREKGNLPAPFLRRCIYFYIKFPEGRLREIVKAHDEKAKQAKQDEGDIIDRAIDCFLEIRKEKSLVKNPGTSEFLDWLKALRTFDGEVPDVAKQLTEGMPLPHRELLFKHSEDWLKDWEVKFKIKPHE
ncbi:MAG: MoxR family ATPase [Microcystis aeruginosa W13-11]|nr:MoxR family ATPase [Microcystis aeruginosa W13-11]